VKSLQTKGGYNQGNLKENVMNYAGWDGHIKEMMKPGYDSPRTQSKQVKATRHGVARSCLVAWGGRATFLPSTPRFCQSSQFECF